MDKITHVEFAEPLLEDEDRERGSGHHPHADEGEDRRYSAEAILEVLDPYAAIIDGISLGQIGKRALSSQSQSHSGAT